MAGRKFGSSGSEWLTWAMNAHVPALVAERYRGLAHRRVLHRLRVPVRRRQRPGSGRVRTADAAARRIRELVRRARTDVPAFLARSAARAGRLIRLSYAIDMRYGVLHDLARKLVARQPIDLTMGHANVIWQGDANDWALRALAHCTAPTSGLNVSGPAQRIRELAEGLAQRLGVAPVFTGSEAPRRGWWTPARRSACSARRGAVGDDARLDRRLGVARHGQPGQAHALRSARRQVLKPSRTRASAQDPHALDRHSRRRAGGAAPRRGDAGASAGARCQPPARPPPPARADALLPRRRRGRPGGGRALDAVRDPRAGLYEPVLALAMQTAREWIPLGGARAAVHDRRPGRTPPRRRCARRSSRARSATTRAC